MPHIRQMALVDEAERRGDAATAYQLIEDMLYDDAGELFWRPERVMRLAQLRILGPWLPRWATSRWIVGQAAQCLDRSRRDQMDRAMEIALEIAGGTAGVRHPPGEDPRIKVMDHNWVFRQCLLYEFGGLHDFLRRRATPDLKAGADRITEWANAPMGGFVHVARESATTTWADLATGEQIETANIGSAISLVQSEHAIGRLVPIEGGRMFETAPLRVGEHVAREVAADPAGWVDVLRRARARGEEVDAGSCRFGFLTDVPNLVSSIGVYDDPTVRDDDGTVRARGLLATARRAFDEQPTDDPETLDIWACLAAEIVHPLVLGGLANGVRPDDHDLLVRLSETLADPAAQFCRDLARDARTAA